MYFQTIKSKNKKKREPVVNVRENENNHTEAFEMAADKLEKLLNEGTREESIQVFLKETFFLIYPEKIHCMPKFSLAEEYVTDFLFAINFQHGPRSVMVEIERASKKIFTKEGYFSLDFTQAKNQLLNWNVWCKENIAFLRGNLSKIEEAPLNLGLMDEPYFHLVMGRDSKMNNHQKQKLCSSFSDVKVQFSTYDHILIRLRQIISNVKATSSQT